MSVRTWMSPDPVTIEPGASVAQARELLEYYGIRHLCVARGDRLVGVISDRDVRVETAALRRALGDGSVSALVADDRGAESIMSSPARVIGVDESVEAAARLMLTHRVSALPVLDDATRLCGIITTTDCLLALLSPTDAAAPEGTAAI